MKTTRFLLFSVIVLLFLSARKGKTTYDLRYVEENMKYIPSKTFVRGGTSDDDAQPATKLEKIKIDSFYLFAFEISNGMYRYYLAQLEKSNGKSTQYLAALPDTLVWRKKISYNEPYVDYYFRHPAYADYPVVGINYEQAIQFCTWLTSNYNAWPERKHKQVTFDLPTKEEWLTAANGPETNRQFPWSGYTMRNSDGQLMANFMIIQESSIYRDSCGGEQFYRGASGGDNTGIAGRLNDNSDITAPVNSYWPNSFGIYNMAGNVEEMVKEKGITKGGSWNDPGYYLTNQSEEKYTDSTATSSMGFRIKMNVVVK